MWWRMLYIPKVVGKKPQTPPPHPQKKTSKKKNNKKNNNNILSFVTEQKCFSIKVLLQITYICVNPIIIKPAHDKTYNVQ